MITKEQAIELARSEFWKDMSYQDIAKFQLHTRCLCMPFGIFHEAVEKALGRSVLTLEFGLDLEGLKKELNGDRPAPTVDDILRLIPEDNRIIMVLNVKE